jgi:hypothetical protein
MIDRIIGWLHGKAAPRPDRRPAPPIQDPVRAPARPDAPKKVGRPPADQTTRAWLLARPEIKAQVDDAIARGVAYVDIAAWLRTEGYPHGDSNIQRYGVASGIRRYRPRTDKEAARGA